MDIRRAIEGDLRNWRGLAATETVQSLTDQLAPLSKTGNPVEKARLQKRYQVTSLTRKATPKSLEAWVLVGSKQVSLIEVDDPVVNDLDGLLESFGSPDLLVSGKRYQEGAMVREHVYAGRGITLSVATPFDGESGGPTRDAVVHLQLYPATTPEAWTTQIGAGAELRPSPR